MLSSLRCPARVFLLVCGGALLGQGCGGGSSAAPAAPTSEPTALEAAARDWLQQGMSEAADLESQIADAFAGEPTIEQATARVDAALAGAVVDAANAEALRSRSDELGGYTHEASPEAASAQAPGSSDFTGCLLSILYVNGVGTTFPEWLTTVETLAKRLRGRLPPGTRVSGVYNTSARDAEMSVMGGRICPLVGTVTFPALRERLVSLCRLAGFGVDLMEAFAQSLQTSDLFRAFGSTPTVGVGQADAIASRISQELGSGRKVILVAHSQGSYFAHQALAALQAAGASLRDISVVMLGSPLASSAIRSLGIDKVAQVVNSSDPVAAPTPVTCFALPATGDTHCFDSPVVGSFLAHHLVADGYLSSDQTAIGNAVVRAISEQMPARMCTPPPPNLEAGMFVMRSAYGKTLPAQVPFDAKLVEDGGAYEYRTTSYSAPPCVVPFIRQIYHNSLTGAVTDRWSESFSPQFPFVYYPEQLTATVYNQETRQSEVWDLGWGYFELRRCNAPTVMDSQRVFVSRDGAHLVVTYYGANVYSR